MSTREVPLTEAAHTAQFDYQRLRTACIRGQVEARQLAGRFWVVNLADVFRLKAKSAKVAK
jgi:hypothetical protein